MKPHCFYCWNDATHTTGEPTSAGPLLVCRDHAPEGAVHLLPPVLQEETETDG